jgi:hypothetical protein
VAEHAGLCDGIGRQLDKVGLDLGKSHDWRTVYRGGACVSLALDVAMRARTPPSSLDDALRALALRSRTEDLDEDDLVEALDACSDGLATRLVRGRALGESSALLRRLGIELRDGKIVLHDDAELAKIRDAIFAPPPPPQK